MKNNPVIEGNKLTHKDIFQAGLHVFGEKIKHTEEKVRTVEDLEQSIEHYKFLYKYNLA